MRKILYFYDNKLSMKGRFSNKYSDIVERWSDYMLQTRGSYPVWLFPLDMNKMILHKFKNNQYLRLKIIRAVLRIVSLFGFSITENLDVVQVKPIYREENRVVIGLHNEKNYVLITRMLLFLEKINMRVLSALVFLVLCRAMKEDSALKHKIYSSAMFRKWVGTQSYIEQTKAEEVFFDVQLEDWEKVSLEELPNTEPKGDAWDD